MTVFGRDTMITCLQTLLFGPELARNALEVLAALQATEDDPSIDAEPGKIVHEVRRGQGRDELVRPLLRHRRRDAALPGPALGALALDGRRRARRRSSRSRRSRARWIDEYGDRDGDGFVEFERRAPTRARRTSRGRTPATRSASTTAASRRRRSRRARCRATSTTRSAASPRSRARSGATARSPTGSSARRTSCAQRFDEAFWVEERGGFYALALDGEKQPRRLALLEHRPPALERHRPAGARRRRRRPADGRRRSGRAGACARCRRRRGVQPAQLPQRHGLAARQLPDRAGASRARALAGGAADRAPHARRGRHFDYQLPEVFAGLARAETPFPIAYPTAARPQAWAAGTPVLLLQLLLGLAARPRRHRLETRRAARAAAVGRRRSGSRASAPSTAVGRARRGRPRARWSDAYEDRGPRPGAGSRCRRPATAGSSGSCRCSPTGSSTPATT